MNIICKSCPIVFFLGLIDFASEQPQLIADGFLLAGC